ncbi:peptidylprolyl isomerase [Tepidimonas taiwanensis]|uniref:peptidylprolyl isomerase n=1 Tax=Tepidimonas taiwanensis TaxID=307486 RepID=A0A554WXJ1_9BURK|nr:peptidylprolyl isomerase [Tepidimonas taiwanensis]MCX7694013.1 peptidylprolyl isomerase [Tepidimonas taiwanensis]TSE28291.1 putative parvulin-type peptidyl-prolyl cis-trans isomerase [Tepidimonas taiwanensis]UBQ06252.1 peptidylprolyl isomerase [Tepidimonas taiwanensis]
MNRFLTRVATATCLTLGLAAPALAQNIAIVNGKPVPTARLKALEQQVARSGRPVDDAVRQQLREEAILREIFMQEAERRGLRASPEVKAQLELATQTVLIRELFADEQRRHPVTDADLKAEYDRIAASMGQEYRARHILVGSEDEAKAIIAELGKGARFEELAKQRSKDPGSGANGGDLDWATPDMFVPEFSEAMVKLGKGEVTSTPVKSPFGWHVIRLDDTRKAQLPPFEDVKPQLQQQLQQKRLAEFQEALRAKAKVQ